jgi:uncharacterized membrane protein YgcG
MAVGYSSRRRLAARIVCALAFVILGLGSLPKMAAQSSDGERILAYDVAIRVHPDSSMDVEETIRVRAAGDQIRHGILRDFPTEYTDANGRSYEVGFHVTKVLRDGQPEEYRVSSMSNGKRVRIGSSSVNLSPGEYTYVIGYKTDHQLGFFEDHDELYWNATGFWGFEIDKATVRVTLPDGVPAEDIRSEAYTGPRGAQGRAYTSSVVEGVPTFETTEKLGTYEGITIVVGWPKGFVTQPPPVQRRIPRSLSWNDLTSGDWWKIKVFRDAGGIAMATVALILLFILVGAWMLIGRDPEGRSIAVAYTPPEHLSAAAMRYIRRLSVDPKALTASVLSMAAKKYINIRKEGSTYVLVRTETEADPPLSSDEDVVAQALFTNDSATAQTAEALHTAEAKIAELQKNHPLLAQMAEGLIHAIGQPDDAKTVHLRRSSTRLMKAFQSAKDRLTEDIPAKTLMTNNVWVIVLAVLFAIAGAVLSLVRYPGQLAGDNGFPPPLAIMFMIFNAFCDLVLGARLAALLPTESFAPTRSVGKKIALFIGLIVAAAFVAATGWLIALATSLEWAAAYVFLWLEIALFARLIKQPTQLGQRYFDEIEGFRQFLAEVDEDRLNRMNPPSKTPELFERMLPYALALDCEVVWAKKFESVLAMAATADASGHSAYSPSWYSGPAAGMINASAFTDAFASSFTSAIASSTTPPGSSSGFSGGGGGGSSGGGGGGGGGGGW